MGYHPCKTELVTTLHTSYVVDRFAHDARSAAMTAQVLSWPGVSSGAVATKSHSSGLLANAIAMVGVTCTHQMPHHLVQTTGISRLPSKLVTDHQILPVGRTPSGLCQIAVALTNSVHLQ